MGKQTRTQTQTRAEFLMTMGAFSLAALTGCAAGAPPDSEFQGTYLSTYTLPGIGENGTFSFSVEQKGKMIGSLTDANTNAVYAFDGVVENTGKFTGTVKNGSTSSPISGLLVTGSGGGTSGTSGGDFTLTRAGSEQRGYFTIGGSLSTVNSDYQGIYSGVYSVDDRLQLDGKGFSGLASYSVDSKGNIIGSMTRSGSAETGLLTGTIGNTGAFAATVRFAVANVTLPLAGTLIKTTDGSAQGNFTVSSGGNIYPASFSKSSSVVAGGDSPYKGAYRGTYGVPNRGETGNISFTIDPSGAIIGFFNQAQNKPVGTLVASVENDGGFSGKVTFNAAEVNALPAAERALYTTRDIFGKIGNRVGGNGVSGDFSISINNSNFAGNFEASIGASEINSDFRAAYSSDNRLTPAFDASLEVTNTFLTGDRLDLSIDKQGSVIGSLGQYRFDGRITNDGRLTGLIYLNLSTPYAIRGIFNRLTYSLPTFIGSLEKEDRPGFKGILYVTINGNEYPLTIKGLGGTGSGG